MQSASRPAPTRLGTVRASLAALSVRKHRVIMQEPEMFAPPCNDAIGTTRNSCFIYCSTASAGRMMKLCEDLCTQGVDVQMVGGSRFCKSGVSTDHGHLTQVIRGVNRIIVCVDSEILERVGIFEFGDALVTAFNVAKTKPSEQLIVAVTEPQLLNPKAWGWNPIFARFSGLEMVDLSMDRSADDWAQTVKHLAEWCTGARKSSRMGSVHEAAAAPAAPSGRGCLIAPSLAEKREHSFRSPWLSRWARSQGRRYDVFLSHAWGEDTEGRDNHVRVMKMASYLRLHGLEVFFDDWEMHKYRSIDEAMVSGMRYASVVVIVLTEKYVQKIVDAQVRDNCAAEFNLSTQVAGRVVAIMESELRNPNNWGYNRVFGQLSSNLYVDLTADDGHMSAMFSCSKRACAVQRWWCGLDALEMRIRTETAMIEGIEVPQNPPPWVPQRDAMVFTAVVFTFAATLDLATLLVQGYLGIEGKEVASITMAGRALSWFCWMVGMFVQAFVQALYCRKPPHFDIHWEEIQWGVVGSSAMRCLAAVLGFVSACLDHAVLAFVALGVFCLGNALQLMAVTFLSRNSENGFDLRRPFTFRNLPHWGACSLAISSSSTAAGMRWKDAFGHQLPVDIFLAAGSGLMWLTALLYLYWSLNSNRALGRYFKTAPRRGEEPAKTSGMLLGNTFVARTATEVATKLGKRESV